MTIKQLWALIKFQAMAAPAMWLMPVIFVFIFSVAGTSSFPSQLSETLIGQNLIFMAVIGINVIGTEPSSISRGRAGLPSSVTTFLLTCAVDRPLLYRAKAVLIYCAICLIPLVALIHSFGTPDLKVDAYSGARQQEYLHSLPGSHLVAGPFDSSCILIPFGRVLAAEWQLGMGIMIVLGLQVLTLLLARVKYRMALYYCILFGVIIWPIFAMGDKSGRGVEHAFYWFIAHQVIAWSLILPVMVVGQIWCERRFSRLEH